MKAIFIAVALLGGVLTFLPGCRSESPQVGSQTNWLRACDSPDACGELVCVCGTCTLGCDDTSDCGGLGAESCMLADDTAVTAACDGRRATIGMCLPSCVDESCPEGTSCVAGACVASRNATTSVVVNLDDQYQTLFGFGASLSLDEDFIVGHPEKERIYDAMFSESGFEFVRVRNRFRGDNAADLEAAQEIIDAAEDRLGRRPRIFMTAGSPPPELKANGVAFCNNTDPDCTLSRNDAGDFDYAGFAEHWRASLEAYAGVGIVPDFVSIQNNPDWLPPDEASVEACRFLPEEGVTTVSTPDGPVEAPFPGYLEALNATMASVDSLPDDYVFSGPETSEVSTFMTYADVLSGVGSLAFHFYQTDPQDVPLEDLEAIQQLAEQRGDSVIQSEMSATALETALLAHHALARANSSGYLQLGFVVATDDEEFGTLIAADDTSFEKRPAYYALAHFARFTEPGWRRVRAESGSEGVLSTAWLSPEENAASLVLINGQDNAMDVEVVLPTQLVSSREHTNVIRTVFPGIERMAELGPLPENSVVRVPGQSMVTVTATSE